MIRTIIIDDEPLALRQMCSYVNGVEELDLVGMFRSAVEAAQFLKSDSVDLIFTDIAMPKVNGVDFVRSFYDGFVGGEGFAPMVIFTTAYSEYAIEGFRLDAVDYLLKPISFDDFSKAVQRAQSLYMLRCIASDREQGSVDESGGGIDSVDGEYITVKSDYRQVPIRFSDIVYVESEGEYLRFNLEGGRRVTTFYRLKNMELELPSSSFVRIHRSYIVNSAYVSSYDRSRVYLSSGDYLPIGASSKDHFLNHMDLRNR